MRTQLKQWYEFWPARAGLLVLMGTLAACETGPSEPIARPPVPQVALVEVTPEWAELPEGGATMLVATPRAADRTPLAGQAVVWASSDTSVAVVSGRGEVAARRAGTATITASSGGKAGAVQLTVTRARVAAVRITPVDTVLEIGRAQRLRAEALAADGTVLQGREVRWITSDSSVVAVDATGRVTARRGGIAVVNAEIEGVMGYARLQVLPDLVGRWALSVHDLEDGSTRCWVHGVELEFSRNGRAVAGLAEPGARGIQSECRILGGTPPFSTPMPPNGPFAGMLASALTVGLWEMDLRFEWDQWQLKGTLSGGSISGTATLQETVQGRQVVRRGRFVLMRLPAAG